jgi:hypothetical protein
VSTPSTPWSALAAASNARGQARLASLTRRSAPVRLPRSLASQKNMDWQADVAAFKFEVYEPSAWHSRTNHNVGTRGR